MKRVLKPFIIGSGSAGAGSPTDVACTTDALIITEQAATITSDVEVSCTTDALAITEQAVTITTGVLVEATTDALIITEQPVSINVAAQTDALVITEQAATVTLTVDVDVQATTDALVITEQAAAVALNEILRPYRVFYDEPSRRRQTYDSSEFSIRGRSTQSTPRPHGPLEIDWTHPLTKGLAIVYFPQTGQDPYRMLYEKGPHKLGRATATNQDPYKGRLSTRDNTVAGYLEWDVDANHWINGAPAVTMMFGGDRVAENGVTIGGGWCFHDSGNSHSRVGAYALSTDNINFQADNADNANASIGDGAMGYGRYYGILAYDGRISISNRAYGYSRQRWVSLGSAAKATSLLTTYDKLYFNGAPYSAVVRGTADWMDYGYVWDRQLTWEEVKTLEDNPYAFFRQVLDIPTFMPQTTDQNVQCTTASLVLSEQSTVSLHRELSTQSLAITEQPATIEYGRQLDAGTDSLVITEQSPTVPFAQLSAQSLTITEHPVGIQVVTTTQALVITEHQATIPVNKDVDATRQALSITEFHAGILPRKVECTTQALTIGAGRTASMHTTVHTQHLTLTGLNPWGVHKRTSVDMLGRYLLVQSEKRRMPVD